MSYIRLLLIVLILFLSMNPIVHATIPEDFSNLVILYKGDNGLQGYPISPGSDIFINLKQFVEIQESGSWMDAKREIEWKKSGKYWELASKTDYNVYTYFFSKIKTKDGISFLVLKKIVELSGSGKIKEFLPEHERYKNILNSVFERTAKLIKENKPATRKGQKSNLILLLKNQTLMVAKIAGWIMIVLGVGGVFYSPKSEQKDKDRI